MVISVLNNVNMWYGNLELDTNSYIFAVEKSIHYFDIIPSAYISIIKCERLSTND